MAEVAPWQVYDQAYYASYAADESADTDLGVSLLIPLDAANRSNGAFRLSLFGGDIDTVRIPAEDVFPAAGKSIRHLTLNFRSPPPGYSSPRTARPATGRMWSP